MASTNKLWSFSAGERGTNRVRVFEKKKGGLLFIEVYESTSIASGTERRRKSLKHRDKATAKVEAEEVAAAIRKQEQVIRPKLTLATLFDIYEREVTPTKGESARKHDQRVFLLAKKEFGANREPNTLSVRDWNRFINNRRSGQLSTRDQLLEPDNTPKQVRHRVIAYDLKTLLAVFNWAALSKDERGKPLLGQNPFKGLPLPVELNPIRRIFTDEQYTTLSIHASAIHPLFTLAVTVAYETGHRIGAIRNLDWSDIDFTNSTIRWRSEHDKRGVEHITCIEEPLLTVLHQAYRARKAIGSGWMFPSPTDSTKPCSRHLMRDWMERGLEKSGIPKGQRYGWHSLRRKFATDLKHTPLSDLCALGGWKDPQTILKCYARPDEVTMRTALRERKRVSA